MSNEKIAYLFQGQGTQHTGMDLKSDPETKELLRLADERLGFPFSKICLEGSEDELRKTINAQPAVYIASCASLLAGRSALESAGLNNPSFVVGHSLGQITAMWAAGCISFSDGIFLTRRRGELMQEFSEKNPGGMIAIIGLGKVAIKKICGAIGFEIANYNSPKQIVICGSKERLKEARELALKGGATAAIILNTGGAFHSGAMEAIAPGIAEALGRIELHDPRISIVANTTARPLLSVYDIKKECENQIWWPVQWEESIEFMLGQGVNLFLEIGPSRVFARLIKEIYKNVEIKHIEDCVKERKQEQQKALLQPNLL